MNYKFTPPFQKQPHTRVSFQSFIKGLLFLTLPLFILSSCYKDDIDTLQEDMAALTSRVAALELWQNETNSNISAIKTILNALEQKDYVTSVTPLADGTGYVINFSQSGSVTIYHGQKGADGYTPEISIKKDTDGVYYWTLDGEWMTDNNGHKIPTTGEKGDAGEQGEQGDKGNDGITPQLKIEEDYWYISYDKGTTWTQLGKATGEDGQPGASGSNGDSMFAKNGVQISDDFSSVTFELVNGETFTLPMSASTIIMFGNNLQSVSEIEIYEEITLPLTINANPYQALTAKIESLGNGEVIMGTKAADNNWKVQLTKGSDASSASAVVTPSGSAKAGDKAILTVTLIDKNGVNHTISKILKYINLSGTETANCYIVPTAGKYIFNATHKGNETTASINKSDISSVEVLWESFGTDAAPSAGDLVNTVSYSNGYITFYATDKKGNAIIAAKSADGSILWSWHIWLTDNPVDQQYLNNAGVMMDRNLGATSATPGDVGALGLFYQWGRKDPFLGSSSISESIPALSTATWPDAVESDSETGTMEYAILNPMTYVYTTTDEDYLDWIYSTGSANGQHRTDWHYNKTIYDPCPAGYRVPEGGVESVINNKNSIWPTAFDNYDTWIYNITYDEENYGYNFGENGSSTLKLSNTESCWYPFTGSIWYGEIYNTSTIGSYWTCTPNPNDYGGVLPFVFYLYPDENAITADMISYTSVGNAVRCVKD